MAGLRRVLLGLWLEIRVIPVLLWSFTAITLGTGLAWHDGDGIAVGGYLAAVAVGVLLQGLVAHCVNEIADWRSGTDQDPSPRVISGGSKVIASGLLGTRELRLTGLAAALAATVLGILAAAEWGWILLAYGAAGLAGAVLYTLPPVRAAYRPFAGEAVAFACIWGCVTGAYVLQRGELSGGAALAGIAYAASCVAMLMMHHYLDRVPDSRARPRKTTTIVLLGAAGRRYGVLWAAIAFAAAVLLAALVDGAFLVMAAGAAVALALHATVDPDDPASVTRNELGVILAGMAGGLGTAAVLVPEMAWALVPAVLLVPIEIAVSGAAHRDLMAARSAPAPAAGEGP
jgi:1,4-dihydroxy-2-naphthoate octaprenyltransferase